MSSTSFRLLNSVFSSLNYAEYGGAIYLDSEASTLIPSVASHILTNVTFTNNSAYHGGALYINEVDYISIRDSTFTQNSATSSSDVKGKGGALYYASSSKFTSHKNIQLYIHMLCYHQDLSFHQILQQNQVVGYSGINQPVLISNIIFESNRATYYGPDKACFAQKLTKITETEYTQYQKSKRVLSNLTGTDALNVGFVFIKST